MHAKLLIFIFAVYLQYEAVLGQSGWMPSANAAQDPMTWFKPYYQSAMETSRNFYQDAMGLASQFYKQYANGNGWGKGDGGMPGYGGMPGFGGMPF